MREFVYSAQPARVIFGSGSFGRLQDEVQRLGMTRVLVLSTPGKMRFAEHAAALLGALCADIFAGAVMHTPVAVTDEAMRIVALKNVDGIVSIGGGSTIGLGKAIALRSDLPQIVVPTTYAGSEVTPIIGETKDGLKTTQTTLKVLPEVVIYDVDLTLGLPAALSVTSGFNAIAHAVEALYAKDGNPIIDIMAAEGARAIANSLPQIVGDPSNREARSDAQYGGWLCGTCLGSVGMSLHHKLCHTLAGTFNLPHAETHTIVLPHALQYNAPAVPGAVTALARVFGKPDPARALYDLAGVLGAPRALRDLGMPENGIDRATDLALSNAYWNPRPLEREAVRACIAAAWAGDLPQGR
ncbi:Maleylacetate reductase [Sphingobium chlorophenolicum L-1]|uniref:Maleylacetate reductase n=1 Tax=Sphingobium chlorophenolicum L-1 TaxID=690566 RepID=F6EZ84_SPHCR|nr:maleylacetate reductase [Sphingobium chlorophenolicum]AEG50177.1 Maleylacetate reductase [Sphingobium chlorophenolicum L-1]